MRAFITVLLMMSVSSTALAVERDKVLHFSVSIPFGAAGTAMMERSYPEASGPTKVIVGTAIGTLPGFFKEVADRDTTGFDEKDLAADALGAFLGSLIVFSINDVLK